MLAIRQDALSRIIRAMSSKFYNFLLYFKWDSVNIRCLQDSDQPVVWYDSYTEMAIYTVDEGFSAQSQIIAGYAGLLSRMGNIMAFFFMVQVKKRLFFEFIVIGKGFHFLARLKEGREIGGCLRHKERA